MACQPRRLSIISALLLAALAGRHSTAGAAAPPVKQKPKVRAVTAFVRIDRAHYQTQISGTLKMLRHAKAAFERGGYNVESIRITTQPFPEYVKGLSKQEALDFFRSYDALAGRESFNPNIGPAMLHDTDDPESVDLLGEVLSTNKALHSSIAIAADDGIHWKSIRVTARMLKFVEEHSPRSQANFSFAAIAMVSPYTPFYPGSYHTGPGRRFSVALEGANLVEEVFAQTRNNPREATERLATVLGDHARTLEAIAQKVEKETGWSYMGLDPTPAPLREVSIATAIEEFTGAKFGSSGTMTAAALITEVLRRIPGKRAGYVGLMLPVLEDSRLAERWSQGTYNIDSLLAYSAVCGTGLDTIPLPGDVTEERLAQILGDVATLAFKWKKPLSARLLPVQGKKPGDRTEFDDPFLVNATIQPLP